MTSHLCCNKKKKSLYAHKMELNCKIALYVSLVNADKRNKSLTKGDLFTSY